MLKVDRIYRIYKASAKDSSGNMIPVDQLDWKQTSLVFGNQDLANQKRIELQKTDNNNYYSVR